MIERERRCIQVAILDPDSYRDNEMHRRVYSADGIAPTIRTSGSGGFEPKILVIGRAPNYRPSGRGGANMIFDTNGTAPTLTTQLSHSNQPLIAVRRSIE